MKKILIAPRKYIQGRNVLSELGDYLKALGERAVILWDQPVKQIVGDTVSQSLGSAGIEMVAVDFSGEATLAERARVTEIARDSGATISVGIGGRKSA